MIIDSSSLGLATCDGHTFVYCGTSRAIPTHSTLVGVRGNYIYGAFTGASRQWCLHWNTGRMVEFNTGIDALQLYVDDGEFFLAADNVIFIYNVESGEYRRTLPHYGGATRFYPGHVAVLYSFSMTIFNLKQGTTVRRYLDLFLKSRYTSATWRDTVALYDTKLGVVVWNSWLKRHRLPLLENKPFKLVAVNGSFAFCHTGVMIHRCALGGSRWRRMGRFGRVRTMTMSSDGNTLILDNAIAVPAHTLELVALKILESLLGPDLISVVRGFLIT